MEEMKKKSAEDVEQLEQQISKILEEKKEAGQAFDEALRQKETEIHGIKEDHIKHIENLKADSASAMEEKEKEHRQTVDEKLFVIQTQKESIDELNKIIKKLEDVNKQRANDIKAV